MPIGQHLLGHFISKRQLFDDIFNVLLMILLDLGILLVVSIGVALGVFFGGILLTIASMYMKR